MLKQNYSRFSLLICSGIFINCRSILKIMINKQKRFFILLLFSCITLFASSQTRSLDFYLNEGMQNSPLLKDLRNQLNTASFDTLLALAARKPQVEVISQLLYSPVYGKFGYDEVITDGGNYQAVASVSQNIFNRKETDNKLQAIGLRGQLISNSSKLTLARKRKVQYLFFSCNIMIVFSRLIQV